MRDGGWIASGGLWRLAQRTTHDTQRCAAPGRRGHHHARPPGLPGPRRQGNSHRLRRLPAQEHPRQPQDSHGRRSHRPHGRGALVGARVSPFRIRRIRQHVLVSAAAGELRASHRRRRPHVRNLPAGPGPQTAGVAQGTAGPGRLASDARPPGGLDGLQRRSRPRGGGRLCPGGPERPGGHRHPRGGQRRIHLQSLESADLEHRARRRGRRLSGRNAPR